MEVWGRFTGRSDFYRFERRKMLQFRGAIERTIKIQNSFEIRAREWAWKNRSILQKSRNADAGNISADARAGTFARKTAWYVWARFIKRWSSDTPRILGVYRF
jgi:hypothetical protein